MDDMSDVVNKFSEILKDKNIDFQDVLNNFSNSSTNSSTNSSENVDNSDNKSNFSDTPNIDFDTIMKLKNIMDKMNSSSNNSRTKLLLSLKPYLKESRKSKLDQCIGLANMSNIIELFKKDSN